MNLAMNQRAREAPRRRRRVTGRLLWVACIAACDESGPSADDASIAYDASVPEAGGGPSELVARAEATLVELGKYQNEQRMLVCQCYEALQFPDRLRCVQALGWRYPSDPACDRRALIDHADGALGLTCELETERRRYACLQGLVTCSDVRTAMSTCDASVHPDEAACAQSFPGLLVINRRLNACAGVDGGAP